jgi:hypothetical protein
MQTYNGDSNVLNDVAYQHNLLQKSQLQQMQQLYMNGELPMSSQQGSGKPPAGANQQMQPQQIPPQQMLPQQMLSQQMPPQQQIAPPSNIQFMPQQQYIPPQAVSQQQETDINDNDIKSIRETETELVRGNQSNGTYLREVKQTNENAPIKMVKKKPIKPKTEKIPKYILDPSIIFILFVLILHPKTSGLFNKLVSPLTKENGDMSVKSLLLRGMILVGVYMCISIIASFVNYE